MILLTLLAGCGPLQVDWPLEGVPCDDLGAYPLTLTWADAPLAEPVPIDVEVSHACDEPARVVLVVDGGPSAEAFGASEESVWIEPGDTAVVEVDFTPSGYADASGAVVLDAGGRTLALPLLGRVDPDQDGDGHRAEVAGGLDCDDLDASVYPGALEYRNAEDEDCDGLADEGWLAPGDLVVTEVWPWTDPWVEVRNTSDLPVELAGWQLQSAEWSWVMEESLRVEPGAHAVLEPSLPLEPVEDDLVLWLGDEPLAGVAWDATWPVASEASLSLDPSLERWPGDPASWCAAEVPTPGSTNSACPVEDADGDGHTVTDGDCDDADPSTYPGAVEGWDWTDRNCNGIVDDAVVGDAAAGWVDAGAAEFFYDYWLHPADTDGDGVELLLPVDDDGGTWILALEGAEVDGADAGYASLAEVRLSDPWAIRLGTSSDVDGDGKDEVVARDGFSAVWVVPGASLGEEATLDDALMEIHGGAWWLQGAALGPDVDGDGQAELFLTGYDHSNSAAFVFPYGAGSAEASDADLALPMGSTALLGSDYVPLWADLTGDGYDDLLLSAQGAHREFLVVEGAALEEAESVIDAVIATVPCCAGTRQPVIADLDGDGGADLVVPSPTSSSAAVLAFLDTPSLGGTVLPADADVTLEGDTDPWFGTSLAAGDLDGDGAAELVVGSTHGPVTGMGEGTVHVFCGDALADGTLADACRSLEESGEAHAAWAMGTAVSAADYDGDGLGDVSTLALHAGDGGRMWFMLSGSAP